MKCDMIDICFILLLLSVEVIKLTKPDPKLSLALPKAEVQVTGSNHTQTIWQQNVPGTRVTNLMPSEQNTNNFVPSKRKKTSDAPQSKSKRKKKLNPFGIRAPTKFRKKVIVIPKRKRSRSRKPLISSEDESENESEAEDQQLEGNDESMSKLTQSKLNIQSKRPQRYKKRKKCYPLKARHRLKIGMRETPYLSNASIPNSQNPMQRLKGYKPKKNKFIKPKRFGVKRQGEKVDDKTEERFSIVIGLHTLLKNTKFKASMKTQFEQFCIEISKLSIEVSHLIYHEYNRIFSNEPRTEIIEEPDFRGLFASLKSTAKGYKCDNIRSLSQSYLQLRIQHGINNGNLYDGLNKTNAIALAADSYKTCLKNNITEHAYSRIKNFFKAVAPRIKSFSTLSYLFNSESDEIPNDELLKLLQDHLQIEDVTHYFVQLHAKWWKYIPVMYRLQQWRQQRTLKNFRVFPILKNKRHYVQYDGQAYQQFLNHVQILSSCYYPDFRPAEDNYWREYFNVAKLETTNVIDGIDYGHKFTNCIATNGISVSVCMKRKKRPETIESNYLNTIANKYNSNEIHELVALDPGARLSFAGIRRNVETGRETAIRYSSTSYRYDSGQYRVNRKYHKLTNHILKKVQQKRNEIPSKASSTNDPVTFINFQLANFEELNEVMMSKPVAKLNFERYICKRRAIEKIAKQLAFGAPKQVNSMKTKQCNDSDEKVVILFVGSTSISPVIKGYVKSPNRLIVKTISSFKNVHVFNVNEHRTTMLCSRCYNPCTTAKSPHRWQYCNCCNITWNRDVNAGRNIMYVGLAQLQQEDPDQGFSYGFKFPKNAKGYLTTSMAPKPHTRRETTNLRAQFRRDLAEQRNLQPAVY